LARETLFISDLHLRHSRPGIIRQFMEFLSTRADGVEGLYILGDLFDAWVGDDDNSSPWKKIKFQLRELTRSGTPIFFQHGNRDFLVGERFLNETGLTLLEDYSVIDLYGTKALLMHGDLLCTDDLPYLEFRNKTRTAEWRDQVLSKPLVFRLAYARWYRVRSFLHKRQKSEAIMDVNQKTVEMVMREHQVDLLIHGHTHRPAEHEVKLDSKTARRLVLPQWENGGSVLVFNEKHHWIEKLAG
jgi:UDP-2,3-diacylglucosamine hydrolase